MRTKSLIIAALLLTTSPLAVHAGTTPEDAAKLKASLQAYLGGDGSAVKITPDGDGYKVTIDSSALAKIAQANGIELNLQAPDFDLKPLGNGKWKIHQEGPFKVAIKSKDQMDISEQADSAVIDGEFDEALGTFTTLNATVKNIAVTEAIQDAKGMTANVSLKYENLDTTMTGVAGTGGGVDFKLGYKVGHGDLIEDISNKGEPPLHLVIKMDDGSAVGTMTNAKSLSILQIIKFFNAHPTKELRGKDQAAFKTILADMLPLFGTMQMTGTIGKTTVESPLGTFSAQKVGVTLAANGAVKDGNFAESLSLEGLVMPPSLVPPWAASLVPKSSSLGFSVSGFDVETVAKAAIAAADFTKEPPISEQVSNSFAAMLLPKGSVKVTLSNTAVSNDTYKITLDGSADAGPAAQPTGKAHITAKGLDDIMKAIQAAPPEAGLQGGAAAVVVAKGMGKAESDGSISWDVEATPDGKITVNGIDVSQMAK